MIFNFAKKIRTVKLSKRFCSSFNVLGIESSCDDTAAAVVNDKGNILGEGHFSQARFHVEAGGILPHVATALHRNYLKDVVDSSVKQSGLNMKELDAIAVTTKPGLILSLQAGVEYAKDLCVLYKKPLIPIHHMEAHALTCRMMELIEFPFLTFLMSGGHCFLALVKSVDQFFVLGQSLSNSAGQVFDKIARRGKLRNMKKYRGLVGGAAIEAAASEGDLTAVPFIARVMGSGSCDFNFSAHWTTALRYIEKQEKQLNLGPDQVIPDIQDLCASLQWAVARHLYQRLELALLYLDEKKFLPSEEKCVVVSGGVASNKFIRKTLKFVCDYYKYKMFVPPPNLCTDNGIMVAWNGIERLRENLPVVPPDDLDSVVAIAKCELGEDISDDVKTFATSVKHPKLKQKDIIRALTSDKILYDDKTNVSL